MTKIKNQLREFIFPEGTVVNSCHASTVLPLENSDVLAAWFGGTAEGNDDVAIYCAKRTAGKWNAPVKIAVPGKPLPHWNPVLFLRTDGTVCLFFKYGKPIAEWATYVSFSRDGESFSIPRELVPGDVGGRGPVKNKCIRLKDGTVLAPASTEKISWRCFTDISHDDGRTFEKSKYVLRPKLGTMPVAMIQPTLWESESGVHMLVRTNRGYIYRSDSANGGRSWSKAYKTPLLNPNSGIDLVKLFDGSLVLISNQVGKNWGDRAPLSLMRSVDDGKSFSEFIKLEPQEGDHEYSYPAIEAVGRRLYITYTYERRTIAYWEIELDI